MTEPYNVVITAPVTMDAVFEVLGGADLYWAVQCEINDVKGIAKIAWWDDGEQHYPDLGRALRPGDHHPDFPDLVLNAKAVTWKQLADGLGLIARGDFQNDPYQQRAAMGIVVDYESSDWDAWTGELMVQAAIFGKVTYG